MPKLNLLLIHPIVEYITLTQDRYKKLPTFKQKCFLPSILSAANILGEIYLRLRHETNYLPVKLLNKLFWWEILNKSTSGWTIKQLRKTVRKTGMYTGSATESITTSGHKST